MKAKKEFNIRAFVVFSLLLFVFVLATLLFIVIKPYFSANPGNQIKNDFKERYYFKEAVSGQDPYISKVPAFSDLLAGPIISGNDPIKGNADAKVSIVMFSDFTCSFCQKQEQLIERALGEYKDKIMVVWKDFPESDEESLSYQAALAGRCAQAQDKFWEYHNRLYQANSLDKGALMAIAGSLDLNLPDFNNCLAAHEAGQLIQDNIEEAHALDINGVPFVYVNDQEIFGQIDYDDLKRLIEIEL